MSAGPDEASRWLLSGSARSRVVHRVDPSGLRLVLPLEAGTRVSYDGTGGPWLIASEREGELTIFQAEGATLVRRARGTPFLEDPAEDAGFQAVVDASGDVIVCQYVVGPGHCERVPPELLEGSEPQFLLGASGRLLGYAGPSPDRGGVLWQGRLPPAR